MNTARRSLQIHTEGTAARATWLAARELHALAKLLQEQAFDLSLAAQQPGVHWGHAGDAQALAHEARKLVARNYLERAGSEAQAEAMVAADVAAKRDAQALATGPRFSMDQGSPDVVQRGDRWFVNMGRPGFNCFANNRDGFPTREKAEACIRKHNRSKVAL